MKKAYEDVGVAVMDRANDYQIINNQRAQVKTIKGKTLVVNQLQKISTNATYTDSETGLTITNNGDGSIRISGTILATKSSSIYITQPVDMTTLTGQTYLTMLGNSSPYLTFRIAGQNNSNIAEGVDNKIWVGTADRINASNIYMGVIGGVGQTIGITIKPKTINLTQCFGAGNEPSTIEEFNRLTMGFDFETYNEGTLTSTEISKFMVGGFNKFDGELESGSIRTADGTLQDSPNGFRTVNYISTVCGSTYTLTIKGLENEGAYEVYLYEYDKNHNYISQSVSLYYNNVITLKDNTCYIKFRVFKANSGWGTNIPANLQICFHLTGNGAFNGTYRPHIAPTEYPIPTVKVSGVGTAQDEIGVDEIVIKNENRKLKDLNWQYQTDKYFYATFNGAKAGTDNLGCEIACSKYDRQDASKIYNGTVDKAIVLNAPFTGQNKIAIRDTRYTDVATFIASFTDDDVLCYELKNPIRLKKKYTGKVDLGTPNWTYVNGTFRPTNITNAKQPIGYETIPNALCSKYKCVSNKEFDTGLDKCFSITDSTSTYIIRFRDTSITDTTTFAQENDGMPFYYETEQEVTETVDELFLPEIILEGVERGGTIATDSNGDVTLTHVVYKPIQ